MGLQTINREEVDMDKRVVLNVGGVRHETWASTLERLPDTRLGILANLLESDENYDPVLGEYFFDRHPRAFDVVLNYYRTDELHADRALCGNTLRAELTFWGIEEQEIEACCWADYSKYTEHKQTLRDLDENFAFMTEDAWASSPSRFKQIASKVWRFLEEPGSSRGAKIYAITSMFFVGLSITVFVLETHKLFQVDKHTGRPIYDLEPDDKPTPTGPSTFTCCCEAEPTDSPKTYTAVTHPVLEIMDYICVAFFAIEIIVRFAFCPDKWRFWKAPLNIIDFVCLIPHFASIIMKKTDVNQEATALVKTIMMLRIVRILRIFKLMKHYNAFKILVYTIKVSTKELLLMIVFLMTGVLTFAAIIHYTEQENFPNIPIAIWWALVTMTTVGYGDKYPVGYMGYCMGSLCVICGVLVIAFTVPIVVNNFSLYYSHAQTRIKAPRQRKKSNKVKVPIRMKSYSSKPSLNSETDNCTGFTSITGTPSPLGKKTDKRKVLERRDTKENNLNIREEEKPQKHKHVASKQVVSSRHGQRDKDGRNGAGKVTPVEHMDREDSGFGENQKKQQIEEATEQIMADLASNNQRMADERKRQEWLIRQKRDARAKKHAEKTGEDDGREAKGKTGDKQKYSNTKKEDQSEA